MTLELKPGDLVMLRDDGNDHWWTVTWAGKDNFTCALCPGDADDVQWSPKYDEILMVARCSDPAFEKWSGGMLEDASWHREAILETGMDPKEELALCKDELYRARDVFHRRGTRIKELEKENKLLKEEKKLETSPTTVYQRFQGVIEALKRENEELRLILAGNANELYRLSGARGPCDHVVLYHSIRMSEKDDEEGAVTCAECGARGVFELGNVKWGNPRYGTS